MYRSPTSMSRGDTITFSTSMLAMRGYSTEESWSEI